MQQQRHLDDQRDAGDISPWAMIAAAAPRLGKAELRVLIHIAAHADGPGCTLQQSSRAIAAAVNLSRSNVVQAIDSLLKKRLIWITDNAAGQTAASYQLQRASQLARGPQEPPSGPVTGPQLANGPRSGPATGPQTPRSGPATGPQTPRSGPATGPQTPRSGPVTGPQNPLPNKERARAHVGSDSDIDSDSIDRGARRKAKLWKTGNAAVDAVLERVTQARPADYSAAQLRDARNWIHGYQAKMRGGGDSVMPPDDGILAQLCAATALWSSEHGPRALVTDLMQDRIQPGERYGWYLIVALQRVHGIHPDTMRRARQREAETMTPPASAAAMPKPARGATAAHDSTADEETRRAVSEAMAAAAARSMR